MDDGVYQSIGFFTITTETDLMALLQRIGGVLCQQLALGSFGGFCFCCCCWTT